VHPPWQNPRYAPDARHWIGLLQYNLSTGEPNQFGPMWLQTSDTDIAQNFFSKIKYFNFLGVKKGHVQKCLDAANVASPVPTATGTVSQQRG
jgi:hypothetical protein